MSTVYRIKIPKCLDVLVHEKNYDSVLALAKLLAEHVCVNYEKIYIHKLTRTNDRIIDEGVIALIKHSR